MPKYLLKILLGLAFCLVISFFGFLIFQQSKQAKTESKEEDPSTFNSLSLSWKEVTSSASWSKRDTHGVVVFKDRIWLMGGLEGENFEGVYENFPHKNDVWVSEDGEDWQLVVEKASWGARRSLVTAVFKDKIWVISGWNGKKDQGLNDVWYSEDGYDWKKTKEQTPWTGREDHISIVFKDKIWMMGGMDTEFQWKNDVWYSTLLP